MATSLWLFGTIIFLLARLKWFSMLLGSGYLKIIAQLVLFCAKNIVVLKKNIEICSRKSIAINLSIKII